MTRPLAILVLCLLPAPALAQDKPPACETAQTCCCTMANGLQCCGASAACGSGAVSGCACGTLVAPG
ncbi:MAG: hypothetical protein F9K34_16715 [Albidovulum sp.]|jgi:hypothetical protein|uniref:hypothetical protein n=1 Tax=Albidovulum sp. TaxID=1872424 RepID=UPI001326957B|nr:hypothetical protein [Defluviimonas sp.]KAB2880575.1 MAG: hypothetical protein F9K34_16715 [Defluviimonas sp.]